MGSANVIREWLLPKEDGRGHRRTVEVTEGLLRSHEDG